MVEKKQLLNNIIRYSISKKKTFLQCLLFFPIFLQAQSFNFSPQIVEKYESILSFQSPKKTTSSNTNGLNIYIQNLQSCVPILLNGEQKQYEKWVDEYEERVELLEDFPENSPYYLYTQAEVKLQGAITQFYFGDRFSSFWDFRSAYKLLQENKKKYPNFLPTYKSLGLLNILLGSVPEEYSWMMNTIGLEGNIKKGIKQLKKVSTNQDVYCQKEAILFLNLVHFFVLKNEEQAITKIESLWKKDKDNLLIQFLLTTFHKKNGNNENAFLTLQYKNKNIKYFEFPYLNILHGEILLQRGNYQQAIPYFQNFITITKSKQYIKHVHYQLFIVYHLLGQNDLGKSELNLVLQEGTTLIDADKYALRFAQKNKIPNTQLIKVRLLTDGGYYQRALKELKTESIYSEDDVLEFHYRKARIFHKLQQTQNAIVHYEKGNKTKSSKK